jgi:hypothetical protein
MIKKISILLVVLGLFSACNQTKDKADKALNKAGEEVGKSASELTHGIVEGVEKSIKAKIEISKELQDLGLEFGKYSIDRSGNNTNRNLLVIYFIFNKKIDTTLNLKAYDKEGVEIGRASIEVKQDAGTADYFDIIFNDRTDIGSKSRILIE